MEQKEKDNVQTAEFALAAGPEQGAEAQKNIGSAEPSPYGKFKSADALLQAYNSLQSEFTRRSQRLKELECNAARNTVKSDVEPAPMSEGNASAAALRAEIPDSGAAAFEAKEAREASQAEQADKADEEAALYERVRNAAGVRQKIIDEYLRDVKNSAVPLLSGGMSVTAPAARARTVEEAGNFALGYFRSRK